MANELQKVGLVFTEEGAVDFKKTLRYKFRIKQKL